MLAPLLLGTGMLFRSIKSNASFLFPRIGLVVVLMWVLWFANSVVQSTVHYLQRQGALDHRVSAAVITGAELLTMLGAGVIVLSALGVNVSGLLLPAGVCLAIAAKDLAHNFLAGRCLSAVRRLHTAALMHALLRRACCRNSTCWLTHMHDNCKHAVCTMEKLRSVAAEHVTSLVVIRLFQSGLQRSCASVQAVCPIALLSYAGFFLFAVQPFRLGDRIAVRSMASGESAASSPGPTGGWYEGCCEQVDLRQALHYQSHV